jgi:Na+-driven multidrug efflux pump
VTPREAGLLLWRLAWPLAVTGQLGILAEGINIYWLDRLLGSEALAVEATLRPVLSCIQWIFIAIATGVSVLVAQSVGARNGRGLSYIASGVQLVLVMWVVLAVIALPLAGPLASMLASSHVSSDDLLQFGLPALLLMTPGLVLVLVLLNAATSAGWTRLATVRMAIDLCATAILVPIFIDMLGLGLAGAPLAQAVVQFAMLVLVWRALYAQRARWHLGDTTQASDSTRSSRWREVVAIGLPIQIARIAMFASYTYLIQRVADQGRVPVVGFGVALLILFFGGALVAAIGRATGIALGQAAGAEDLPRALVVLRVGLVLGTIAGCVVAVASYALADRLVGIFASEPAAVVRGAEALRILALALVPLGSAAVCMFALTAVKASRLAGLVAIASDALGVVFAIVWPSDDALVVAAWSICVSNVLRVLLYAWTTHTVMTRALRDAAARRQIE